MTTLTADAMALRIILTSSTPHKAARRLAMLTRTVSIGSGRLCPGCDGSRIEDNGETGRNASFRCLDCGEGWDAAS